MRSMQTHAPCRRREGRACIRWSKISVGFSLGKFYATNYSLTFHDEYPSQTYCNVSLSQNCTVENGPSVMAGEVDIQAFLTSLAGRDLASV